jgi:hypothetical protein
MKKTIIKILLIITLLFSFWNLTVNAKFFDTEDSSIQNTYDNKVNSNNRSSENHINNDYLEDSKSNNHIWKATRWWVEWISDLMMNIAQSLKNIFIAIASIYFLIITLKLLFSEWSNDEEFTKFKKWAQWITMWIIVMQIAYSYVSMIYNKKIWADIAAWLIENIVQPLIKLLETAASFFFIAVMVFAFYKIVTAGWDDEKAKSWKKSVWFAILGFLVIEVSNFFVEATYSKTLCNVEWVTSCVNERSLSDWARIIFDIINWLNGFVWIAVVIMIIYAWAQIIFSAWDDEKIKKAKKSIIYILIWITLLIMNYLILTFFLIDDLTQ